MRREGCSGRTTVTRTDRETHGPGRPVGQDRPLPHEAPRRPIPGRRGAAVASLLALVLVLSTGCAALDLMLVIDAPKSYLNGRSFGPYRGRVVDAETGAPLAGAVVVATWDHRRLGPGHTWVVRYAARETVTDVDGRYHLDVRHLEEWAPRSTEPPTFRVFAPGYVPFGPGWIGEPAGRGAASDAVVRLRGLRTLEERRRHLPDVYEPLDRGNPFRHLPHFVRLVNRECVELGLPPHTEASYREHRTLSR